MEGNIERKKWKGRIREDQKGLKKRRVTNEENKDECRKKKRNKEECWK